MPNSVIRSFQLIKNSTTGQLIQYQFTHEIENKMTMSPENFEKLFVQKKDLASLGGQVFYSKLKEIPEMHVSCPIGQFFLNISNVDVDDHCSPCPSLESSSPWQPATCLRCQELLLKSVPQKSKDFWGNDIQYLSYEGFIAHKLCHDQPDILYPKEVQPPATDDEKAPGTDE